MTMADNVIRKACDRCHTQKLSCKRKGEEPCERCTRLNTECKSSPSLRYKKQQQQQRQLQQHQQQKHQHQHQHQQSQPQSQQQQQSPQTYHHQYHQQHQVQHHQHAAPAQIPGSGIVQIRSRSPKRRRTDSDPSLVLPETVPTVPSAEDASAKVHGPVTPDTALDISDFNFTFDQLGFFPPPQPEHLSHPGLPGTVEDFSLQQGLLIDPWDQYQHQHQFTTSSSGLSVTAPTQFPLPETSLPLQILSPGPSRAVRRRSGVSERSTVSEKRSLHRSKQRPRQIALRQSALRSQPTSSNTSSAHWMAQLNDINTRLLDLSSALPKQQETALNGPSLCLPQDERFKANGFPIDEMFQLTRRVADILDHCSSSSSPVKETAPKARPVVLDASDPGNSMLVLSTYVRLLDMYQRVFDLVSIEVGQTDSGAAFRFWKLPDVSVGSFAVESSPSLQMSLTIQLAEEFLSRLRNATATLESHSTRNGGSSSQEGGSGKSPFTGVVDVSYQAVKSREESLGRHLGELRVEIEALLEP